MTYFAETPNDTKESINIFVCVSCVRNKLDVDAMIIKLSLTFRPTNEEHLLENHFLRHLFKKGKHRFTSMLARRGMLKRRAVIKVIKIIAFIKVIKIIAIVSKEAL